MRHPAPCRYDDSISGGPDSDYCDNLPTCPNNPLIAAIVAARSYIHGPAESREINYTAWREAYRKAFGIYP